jgi:hypothetical protein
VDTIQVLLGDLLLVMAGLALFLLAVILLLIQANAIVWLVSRLARSLRADDRAGAEQDMPVGDRPHARSASSEGGD